MESKKDIRLKRGAAAVISGERAAADYKAAAVAADARMQELRALRLARDAAEAAKPVVKKPASRKRAAKAEQPQPAASGDEA